MVRPRLVLLCLVRFLLFSLILQPKNTRIVSNLFGGNAMQRGPACILVATAKLEGRQRARIREQTVKRPAHWVVLPKPWSPLFPMGSYSSSTSVQYPMEAPWHVTQQLTKTSTCNEFASPVRHSTRHQAKILPNGLHGPRWGHSDYQKIPHFKWNCGRRQQ